jgi:2-amino-4-hydroxy-6-hydroxymethyldihydropteridine diphosphokinase
MRAGIALGSNLDERLKCLRSAHDYLRSLHEDRGPFLSSRIFETEPLDCPAGSPRFLNAVIEIACTMPPLDLLARLQRIEELLGRPRIHGFHAPRTIDLDILYYDNLISVLLSSLCRILGCMSDLLSFARLPIFVPTAFCLGWKKASLCLLES